MGIDKVKLVKAILGEPPAIEPPDELIFELISALKNEQQERGIKALFGIGEPEKSWEQVGRDLKRKDGGLGVSIARVGQIRRKALERLKWIIETQQSKGFQPYMNDWKKMWELLENKLQTDLGVAHSIPTEQELPIFDEIYEEHLRSYREGRVSKPSTREKVFRLLTDAVEHRRRWRRDPWRPEPSD